MSPRQTGFVTKYTTPESSTFGNCYKSAIAAGYSSETARNITHVRPKWFTESIGQITAIQPEQITQALTGIIYSPTEPTAIKLKAIELMMRYHSMLKPQATPQVVSVTMDLTTTPG